MPQSPMTKLFNHMTETRLKVRVVANFQGDSLVLFQGNKAHTTNSRTRIRLVEVILRLREHVLLRKHRMGIG